MHGVYPLPNFLSERYKGWRAVRFEESRAWYQRLMDEGQRPRTMVIACCDSRIDVTGLFSAEPGELFVVRNVANLIPPYHPDHAHHGTSAAIEYAVKSLKVAHIVVVGHAKCGGVQAYHDARCGCDDDPVDEGEFIGAWMKILAPAWEEIDQTEQDPATRQRMLEQASVSMSLRNLGGFPFVAEAVEKRGLRLHGCWLDIADGSLHVYDGDSGAFGAL